MNPDVPGRIELSVVVPTRNEAGSIDELLDRLLAAMGNTTRFEVIVVDDGSTDGTRERVRAWRGRGPVRLIERNDERGLNGAVMRGVSEARSDVIVVMDADLSHPPEAVPALASAVQGGAHDVAVGSRYVRGGRIEGWPLRRHVASRVAGALAWPFADVRDPMAGFFATRRDLLLDLDPEAGGYKILLELLATGGESIRATEVPITFRERRHGASKLGPSVVMSYLRQLVTLAGGSPVRGNALRFGAVGLLGFALDLGMFSWLTSRGLSIGTAHVTSFFCATVLNYVLNEIWSFRSADRSRGLAVSRYFSFLLVCVAALFLRGGVLGTAVDLGLPPWGGLVAAIGVAAVVNYLGCLFIVFADRSRLTPAMRWRLAAIGISCYAVLLRVAYIGSIDLLPEEAYYWNYAQHLSIGYLDHPPMVAWLIGASTALFGDSEFAVRLPALLCWMVTAAFAFALTRRLLGKTAALCVLVLVSILPFFFFVGLLMSPDAPLTACWAAAIFYLHRAMVDERPRAWIGVGAAAGLGLLSKYTIALLGPAALLFMLLDSRARRMLLTPGPYLAAAMALVIFSPVIWWNGQHDWASFAFQTTHRLSHAAEFSLHMLAISVILLLTPTAAIGAAIVLSRSSARSMLPARSGRLLVVLALVPLSVFVWFSLDHETKLNWTGPLWLALVPVIGDRLWRGELKRRARDIVIHRIVWRGTIAVTVLFMGAVLHFVSLGFAGIPVSRGMWMPVAWEELGSLVEAIEDDIEGLQLSEPLVVGMDKYFIASELAYYRERVTAPRGEFNEGPAETASRSLFGRSGLMYGQWFERDDHVGRTMILVSRSTEALSDEHVRGWFDRMGSIRIMPVLKGGSRVTDFYYRVGFGYLGSPQRDAAGTPVNLFGRHAMTAVDRHLSRPVGS